MDGKTFRKIVSLMKPFVTTTDEREALIALTLFGTPFGSQIQVEGSPDVFSINLIKRLSDETIGDEPAVVPLLEYLHDNVGDTKQAEIDAILQTLRTGKPTSQASTAPPPNKEISKGMNISIGGNVSGENVNIGGNQTINGDFTVNKTRRDK